MGAANESDVKVAPWVLLWVVEQYERIEKILADQGYRGDFGRDLEVIYGVVLEIAQHEGKGFTVEAKRWIVERTWAWLDNSRSLTRDYERLPENHAGMVYIVMTRLMLRRLEKNRKKWQGKAV